MFSNKVLLAYDGSEGAEHALEKTKELAKLNPMLNVHIVFINEQPKIMAAEAVVSKPAPDVDDLDEEKIAKLERAKKELSELVTTTNQVLFSDNPEIDILDQVKEHRCDMIVIGSRGLRGIKKLILGSVSSYVVNNADVPVLVTK